MSERYALPTDATTAGFLVSLRSAGVVEVVVVELVVVELVTVVTEGVVVVSVEGSVIIALASSGQNSLIF